MDFTSVFESGMQFFSAKIVIVELFTQCYAFSEKF